MQTTDSLTGGMGGALPLPSGEGSGVNGEMAVA